MKLRINAKLRAALIAAVSAVGFTTFSTGTVAVATGTALLASQQAWASVIQASDTLATNKALADVEGSAITLSGMSYANSASNTNQKSISDNVFSPDIKINGADGWWTLTFTLTNSTEKAITLDSLTLDMTMYNASGGNQNPPTYRSTQLTLTQDSTVLYTDNIVLSSVADSRLNGSYLYNLAEQQVTDQKPTLTLGQGGITLDAGTSQTFTLKAERSTIREGATNIDGGCFFGLKDMVVNYSYEGVVSTWNGSAGHTNWTDADAWSGGVPAASSPIIFDNTASVKSVVVNEAVTAGSITVSGEYTFELQNALTTSNLTISDGGSLALTGTGTVNASSISASGKTIDIGENVVLQGGTGDAATLVGSGTYVLASGSKSLGSISLGNDWTGYVRLSGVSFSNDNIDNLARGGDAGVEMAGITGGYAANWNGGTVRADIRLTNPNGTNDNIAWKWSDGTTADQATYPTVTFDGTWDGSGTFKLTEKRQCVTFSGNISGWDGAFDYSGQHGTKLTFTGNATTVNAAILNNGTNDASKAWKQFHLIVDNNATFNKAVGAYTLEITSGHTAIFNDTTSFANGVTLASDATLVNAGAMTINGTITFGANAIENNGTGSITLGNDVIFNIAGLTAESNKYTLFSGTGDKIDLSGHGYTFANIAGVTTAGRTWTFNNDGTISYAVSSSKVWTGGAEGDWDYSSANWNTTETFASGDSATFSDGIFGVNVAADIVAGVVTVAENAIVALEAGDGGSLSAQALVVNGTLSTSVEIANLDNYTVAEEAGWAISGEQKLGNGTIDGMIYVAETGHVTVTATTPTDVLAGINNEGVVSVNLGGATAKIDMADSTGVLEVSNGKVDYLSNLGSQTLKMGSGTTLHFGNNAGTKDDAVFSNNIVLDGDATVEVYGNSKHSSVTISGDVEGAHTLTKADGNQNLTFSGKVNIAGLTTANNGNGTIIFNGGEGAIGKIKTNGAVTIRFSAKDGADNVYSFDTFEIAPSTAQRWLIVDKDVIVNGTGSNLGNVNATIMNSWGLNGGGLEVNGTLNTAGTIGMDAGNNAATIKGTGIINTAGLDLANNTPTTIQGGITINITSDKGIWRRNNAATVHFQDATLQALTADWAMQSGYTSVTLDNTAVGTTFEAAAGRTITLNNALSGDGKLVKAGEGTLILTKNNTYTGDTVVKGGTLQVNGSLSADSTISVEGDAILAGTGVDIANVSIAATKTATFKDGITTEEGIVFAKEGGVEVKNTSAVTPIAYDLEEANAQVTADTMTVGNADTQTEINNSLVVGVIVNNNTEGLLLNGNVANGVTLNAAAGDITMVGQTSNTLSVVDLTIAVGKTVELIDGDQTEGTITVTDTLTGGSATLLANLTLVGGSTLDVDGGDTHALTLGSMLTVDYASGLINLDEETIAALNGLADGASLALIKAGQVDLEYAENYNGIGYDNMFVRANGLAGDYTVYANNGAFGLTKQGAVPEPTTGTLSLLALMALAARRRRK